MIQKVGLHTNQSPIIKSSSLHFKMEGAYFTVMILFLKSNHEYNAISH